MSNFDSKHTKKHENVINIAKKNIYSLHIDIIIIKI